MTGMPDWPFYFFTRGHWRSLNWWKNECAALRSSPAMQDLQLRRRTSPEMSDVGGLSSQTLSMPWVARIRKLEQINSVNGLNQFESYQSYQHIHILHNFEDHCSQQRLNMLFPFPGPKRQASSSESGSWVWASKRTSQPTVACCHMLSILIILILVTSKSFFWCALLHFVGLIACHCMDCTLGWDAPAWLFDQWLQDVAGPKSRTSRSFQVPELPPASPVFLGKKRV